MKKLRKLLYLCPLLALAVATPVGIGLRTPVAIAAQDDDPKKSQREPCLLLTTGVNFGSSLAKSIKGGRNQGAEGGFAKGVNEIVGSELVAGRIPMVDRDNLSTLQAEEILQLQGITDASSATALGKKSSAKYILIGTVDADMGTQNIIEKVYKVKLSYRLVDIETGVPIFTVDAEGKEKVGIFGVLLDLGSDDAWVNNPLGKACRKAGKDLTEKLRKRGGDIFAQRFPVVEAPSDTEVVIEGGTKDGLTNELKVCIWRIRKIGSFMKKELLAKGKIQESQATASILTVSLTKPDIKVVAGDVMMIDEEENAKK